MAVLYTGGAIFQDLKGGIELLGKDQQSNFCIGNCFVSVS